MVILTVPGSLVAVDHDGPERIQILHGAFAVRGSVADDDRAAIILQRGGGDFGGGGAEPVDHHGQRTVVKHGRIGVGIHGDVAVGRARLDDRAILDEKAGELDGFLQRAAGIVPQIQNDAGDFFLFKFLDQLGDIGGGASAWYGRCRADQSSRKTRAGQ